MPDIIKSRADSLGPGATERFVDVTGLNEMAQQVVIAGGGGGAATIADGADVAEGTTTDAAASSTVAENATARTGIGLWKGIKNLLKLINDKLVTGTIIGDVNVRAITAGETHLGEVGGRGLPITVTPTLTVGATYVANDFVGTNNTAMTFAGAARVTGGSGRVIGATLHDFVIASVAAELWLFSVAPAGLGLDSAAFTITDADNLLCIGVIPFNTYYASALNSHSVGTIPNGELPFKCPVGATSLFGALVTRGAPAYTNGLVSVSIFVDQD
jgi:hypothetical protein